MIDSILPSLAFAQERLWFLQKLDPDDRSYQFQAKLMLDGPLDVRALECALDAIVGRHEIFRTTFPAVAGAPVLRVESHAPPVLRIIDLTRDGAPPDEAGLSKAIDDVLAERFDITRLPLVRWTLLRLGADRHVLVQMEHHLVHDGWSFYVVLDELAALYRGFVAGTPAELPTPPAFTAFARAQREAADGVAGDAGLAYWQATLAGAPALLHLPTDRARPPVQTHAGDAIVHELSHATLRGLEALGRTNRATVFMAMFAAFSVVLQRYSGDTDMCIGTGVAGRGRPEYERLVGMVVNSVVLRVDLSGDPTFLELLERVRATAIGAYANEHVPLERVVAALAPTRDPSFNPVFTTMFAFHDSPYPTLDFGALSVVLDQTIDNGSAKLDLNVIALPHADGITLKWEFNRDLFDRATMVRMLDHFESLLAAVIDEPERRISRFDLMTGHERTILLEQFAHTREAYDRNVGICELFGRVVKRTPDAPALRFDTTVMTYAQLDAHANRLAHHLQRSGVTVRTPVGILLDRSPNAVIAMLAVLKAGGMYVPLTTRYPAERIAWICADAQIALTLTSSALRHLLPASAATVCLDERAEEIAAEPASGAYRSTAAKSAAQPPSGAYQSMAARSAFKPTSDPSQSTAADSLAYVMYTSGSTGTPKGVCVTQRGITRLVAAGTAVAIEPADVVANYSSSAFDASTYEIWGALLNGASLAIIPAGMLSLTELANALRSDAVTVTFLTTPLFNQMVESERDALGGLRLLVTGGEVMSPAHARRFVERHPACRLVNVYGPTENTTFTTTHDVTLATAARTSVPLGRPLANSSVYVLDGHRKPVPIDVPGERYTGGDGVARGYCNRPELTAERFAADPFSSEPGARLYRTGDLARWRGDGTLEFLGRADNQVKVRGFRIELGAIETALRSHPAVREAAVAVGHTSEGDKHIVAFVVALPGTALEAPELRAFLAGRLPDYEVPSRITMVDALPTGVGGKLDRSQIANEPALPAPLSVSAQAAPRGMVEERLAQLWMQLLDVPSVARDVDFFAIGGHSLLAMRLLARLNDAFAVDVALRELFEHRTIAELAQAVARAPKRRDAAGPEQPIVLAPPIAAGLGDLTALTDAQIDALLSGELAGISPTA